MIRKAVIALGTVAIVAAATFALWTALGVDLGGGTSAQGEPNTGTGAPGDTDESWEATGTVLRTSNRDRLELCLEFVEVPDSDATSDTIVQNVEAAVSAAAIDPVMELGGLTDTNTSVDVGCPAPSSRGQAPTVDTPSRYLLFVFVVPDDQISDFLGGRAAPYAPQEFTCDGDDCEEVTAGAYLGLEEASNPERVATVIRYALGLESRENVIN